MDDKKTDQYMEIKDTDKTAQGSFNGGSNSGTNGGTRKKRGVFGSLRSSAKSEQEDVTRDLHKLTRTELLEMLVDETKEADRLRVENRRLRKELERAKEDLDRSASLSAVIAKLEEIVERAGRQN